jgi:hypothetical protein
MSIILICPNVFLKNWRGFKNFKVGGALLRELSRCILNVNGESCRLFSRNFVDRPVKKTRWLLKIYRAKGSCSHALRQGGGGELIYWLRNLV